MILEKVGEDKPIIVLHTHLWSAITWPLITTPGPRRSTFFSLDPEGQAEWLTVFDPNTYEVIPAVPVMSEGWLCLESSSASQPFLEYVVGHYSCDLSFFQLCAAARYLNCVEGNVKNKSRKQLLLSVAKHLGLDPDHLVDLDKKQSSTQSFSRDVSDLQLVQDVLENMDGDERHTYKGLRDKVASHDHVQKRKQWMHWLKEKREEVKVLGCCISELLFFLLFSKRNGLDHDESKFAAVHVSCNPERTRRRKPKPKPKPRPKQRQKQKGAQRPNQSHRPRGRGNNHEMMIRMEMAVTMMKTMMAIKVQDMVESPVVRQLLLPKWPRALVWSNLINKMFLSWMKTL